MQDLAATIVMYGRIFAALKIPGRILLWDLFAHTCSDITPVGQDPEAIDLVEELKCIPGMRFLDLQEFISKVAAQVSPEA